MKKKFLFAAMAIAALASCSNDELIDVNSGEGISFRTSLDKATRGTTANVSTLENLKDFKVTAIGNNSNYFTDLQVSSDNQGASWNTASTYYWPSYDLKFFAYAPITGVGTVNINKDAQQITGFSPATEVAQQKDLLIAYNTGNKAANEEPGVPMNFKHALSQIEIKAKCSNPNIKIEVKGVRIVNPATSGNFTFPTEETTSLYSLPQSKWTELKGADASAYKIKGDNAVELNGNPSSLMFGDNNFMLIPQALTPWAGNTSKTGAYISVLCRIYSVNGKENTLLYPQPTTDDPKEGKYAYASVAIDTNWEPGKKYIYTLEFCSADTGGNGGGLIDPNPDSESDPEVDSTPKDGSQGGDPVLNGPIKFTVTVDQWVDVTKDILMK